MERRNNNQASPDGGMNGLFLGLLMGAGLTLLFTTKKGRQIVKTLTDEGFEDLSKLQDMIDVLKDEEVTPIDTQDVTQPKSSEEPKTIAHSTRRFFKGIRKKS